MFHSKAQGLGMRTTKFYATIGLALAIIPFATRESHADAPPLGSPQNIKLAHEAVIAAALDELTELDFTEQPLTDVIDFLKERHNIQIQLDHKALADTGVGTDVPITRSIKGITLESALDLILSQLDLTWVIYDEVLFITSQAAAENMIETRVYPVRDLLTIPGDEVDYDSLVDVVAEAAAAKETAPDPRSIRVYRPAGALVVTRPITIHRRIEKLLKELRRAKAETPAR